MYKYLLFFFMVLLWVHDSVAQKTDSAGMQLILPKGEAWKNIMEGETLNIRITARGLENASYKFSFQSIHMEEMRMDFRGDFWWSVGEDIADSINTVVQVPIVFFVSDDRDGRDSLEVIINVSNKVHEEVPIGEMELMFDQVAGWNLLNEGDTLDLQLKTKIGNTFLEEIRYYIEGNDETNIEFDSTGHFRWIPSFNFVDRLQETRDEHIFFIAEGPDGRSGSAKILFTIFHKNRAPLIEPLPIFYVVQGTNNVFQLPANRVVDPDGDPVVIIPVPDQMPEGAVLSSKGKLSWEPSRFQFSQLLEEPKVIQFFVEDQPYKARTSGLLKIEASKMDLPPEITVIPADTVFEIREDQSVNLNFYLGDPNGDEDVAEFDFVSDTPGVPDETLIKNTDTQYEFVWTPGFDFVSDPDMYRLITLRFFAFDQSRNSTERVLKIKVKETRNMVRIDNENYARYRDILVRSLDLIDQLDENVRVLEKKLKKAKKGKKNRALVSASFGAITGLSPLVFEDDTQKIVSGVGGTTVMTMGTLEARDAVGESLDEVGNLIKINVQLKNKLQNEGDGFARRYSSKSSRRNEGFPFDLDKLKSNLNDPNIVKLELDPTWENPKTITDRRLKQNFVDFKPQN